MKFAASLLLLAAYASGCVEVERSSASSTQPAAQASYRATYPATAHEGDDVGGEQGRLDGSVANADVTLNAGEILGQGLDERRVLPAPYIVDLAPGETVRVLTVEQWRVLQSAFPERTYVMARIAYCESRFRSDVTGLAGEVGWFQIHPVHGHAVEALRDPAYNAQVAAGFAAARPSLSDWYHTRDGCKEWSR